MLLTKNALKIERYDGEPITSEEELRQIIPPEAVDAASKLAKKNPKNAINWLSERGDLKLTLY